MIDLTGLWSSPLMVLLMDGPRAGRWYYLKPNTSVFCLTLAEIDGRTGEPFYATHIFDVHYIQLMTGVVACGFYRGRA